MNFPARVLVCCALAVGIGLSLEAQVNVLTYHNDQARTGQNLNETLLTPTNVNPTSFRKLFSAAVDGYVYAQPLIVCGVSVPGKGVHNVVFIATEHNSLYAFDADSNAGGAGMLWHKNFGPTAAAPDPVLWNRYGPYTDLVPEIGITSTPVIDLSSGTIYVDAFTHEASGFYHRIHALNIANGAERPYSPVVVAATVPGQGYDNVNGVVSFNAVQELQRCALTLAGGILYVAYASYGDTDPYHGWIIGFQPSTLQQLSGNTFNDTPNSTVAGFGSNAGEGGIWMSGCGLAVDADTNLFVSIGNGAFDGTSGSLGTEFGNSIIRLSTSSSLQVTDFFTPANQDYLASNDKDVGSGGVVLLPDEVGSVAHPHLMVNCGKEGKIYLLDRDNLGHYNSLTDPAVQEVPGANNGTWSTAAYFNGLIYYLGAGDTGGWQDSMKAFQISNGSLITNPVSQTTGQFFFPGATPSISADGTNNAIVWAIQSDGYNNNSPAILHAYNAYDLSQELYNSEQAGQRDRCGGAVKFSVPTIANGKVYVGGEYSFSVFGLGSANSGPLVQINGSGSVSPNYDRSKLVNGKRFTITAAPRPGYVFNGWSGSVNSNSRTLSFTMEDGFSLVANFVPNPFGPVAGNYQGLFSDPNGIAAQSSGLLSATVSKTGTFSARFQLGSGRYSISGQFLGSGSFSNSILHKGQAPISIQFQLALDGGTTLNGTIGNDTWKAQVSAYRGIFSRTNQAPQANQRFTLLIPGSGDPASQPQGDGFASLKVDPLGRVSVGGVLSDGAKFSESALLSPQGQWALFSAPYSGKGEVFGWLMFTSGQADDLEGQVSWSKVSHAPTKLYPEGFTNSIGAFGSRFLFTNNTPVLNLAPGTVSLTGGNLSSSFTNQVTLGPNNKVSGRKFSLAINPSTGLFKGSALPSSPGKQVSFNGAVLQKQNYGSGFFLGTNQSGRVLLGP